MVLGLLVCVYLLLFGVCVRGRVIRREHMHTVHRAAAAARGAAAR
eukprot:SAG22_NODE_8623_length_640_cov_9.957486_2_plen_44_part_01